MIASWNLDATLGVAVTGVLGLLFALGGAWWTVSQLRMRGTATGYVIETEVGPECETLPVVTFNAASEIATRFVGDRGIGRRRGPQIGASVAVRYDLDRPTSARIATFRQGLLAPLGLLVWGLALLVAASFIARDAGRATAATPSPNERIAAYIPLKGAAMDLCIFASCTAGRTTRSLRDYDRAKAAALRSPATSSRVRSEIATVERALRPLRRGPQPAIATLRRQTARLLAVLQGELLDLRCGRSCQRHFIATH